MKALCIALGLITLTPFRAAADVIPITSGSFVGASLGGAATFAGADDGFEIGLGIGSGQPPCFICQPGDVVRMRWTWGGSDVYGGGGSPWAAAFTMEGPSLVVPALTPGVPITLTVADIQIYARFAPDQFLDPLGHTREFAGTGLLTMNLYTLAMTPTLDVYELSNWRVDAVPVQAASAISAVPEPASLWCLGTGLLGLLKRRR